MTIHATLRNDDADGAITFLTGALGLVEQDIDRDDVDTHQAELADQPYGSREDAVADPEGTVWSVGTHRPAVTE